MFTYSKAIPIVATPDVLVCGARCLFQCHRVPGDNTVPAEWTHAEIRGRQDAWRMFELWQAHLPEFAHAYFFTSGP